MLPSELLFTIFECLSRRDLDALLLANAKCSSLIATSFVDSPLRQIRWMHVRQADPNRFQFNLDRYRPNLDFMPVIVTRLSRDKRETSLALSKETFGQLRKLLHAAVVHKLCFFGAPDEDLIAALYPLRHAWSDGLCIVSSNSRFSTRLEFTQATRELLTCKTLELQSWPAESVYAPLPPVQNLKALNVWFTSDDLSDWLHGETRWNDEPKRLELHADRVRDLPELVALFKKAFLEARTPRPYLVKVLDVCDDYTDLICTLENEETFEIFHVNTADHREMHEPVTLTVERKPMENVRNRDVQ